MLMANVRTGHNGLTKILITNSISEQSYAIRQEAANNNQAKGQLHVLRQYKLCTKTDKKLNVDNGDLSALQTVPTFKFDP